MAKSKKQNEIFWGDIGSDKQLLRSIYNDYHEGDGKVDVYEIDDLLRRRLGLNIDYDTVVKLFNEADSINRDGNIDFEEFQNLFAKIQKDYTVDPKKNISNKLVQSAKITNPQQDEIQEAVNEVFGIEPPGSTLLKSLNQGVKQQYDA